METIIMTKNLIVTIAVCVTEHETIYCRVKKQSMNVHFKKNEIRSPYINQKYNLYNFI